MYLGYQQFCGPCDSSFFVFLRGDLFREMYMAVEGRVVVVKVKVGAHSIDRVSGPCNSWFHLKKKKSIFHGIFTSAF